VPGAVTAYYDPILEVHHRLPVTFAMTYCFYLAPQVPDETRRLFDAAAASAGISAEGVADLSGHRINAIAWFLAREWGLNELEASIREALETNYEPTWDRTRGEFTWGLGLGEPHPRGQYNGFLAAGEVVTPGAWMRASSAPIPKQPGLVEGVDFPTVALAEARWENRKLHLRLHPQNEKVEGQPTRFRVSGLDDPSRWQVEGDARLSSEAGDLVVETAVRDQRLTLRPVE
jgi:hypothetical protein